MVDGILQEFKHQKKFIKKNLMQNIMMNIELKKKMLLGFKI